MEHRFLIFNLCFFLILVCSETSTSIPSNGDFKPNDPFVFVGENLTMTCSEDTARNASDLFINRNGEKIPKKYVEIRTKSAIRLRYPVDKIENESQFVCHLHRGNGVKPLTIGMQRVKVDYPPVKIKAIQCRVFNWQNMTCTWDLPDYRYPQHIKTIVKCRYISGNSCESTTMNCGQHIMKGPGTSFTWPSACILHGIAHQVRVVVRNTKRIVRFTSRWFRVNTEDVVEPAAVVSLHSSAVEERCVRLVWYHSDDVHRKLSFIEYSSEWNTSVWHQTKGPKFEGKGNVSVCGLTPYTTYTFRVAVQPVNETALADNVTGFLSQWQNVTVRTLPAEPEVGPQLCAGCFSEVKCNSSHCRSVRLYWKHIPKPLRQSTISSYRLVDIPHDDSSAWSGRNWTVASTSNSLELSWEDTSDHHVQLWAVTQEGRLSTRHSTLIIPSLQTKPAGAEEVVAEAEYTDGSWNGRLHVRWEDGGPETDSVIVAWCRRSRALKACIEDEQNEMQWQSVPGSTSHTIVTISRTDRPTNQESSSIQDGQAGPEDYMVGVSRQVRDEDQNILSSGLVWIDCIYVKKGEGVSHPQHKPDNVQVHGADGILTWTYWECGQFYLTGFHIFICQLDDILNECKGKELKRTVSRTARRAPLEDLQEDRTYRIRMAANFDGVQGPRTAPVNYTVQLRQTSRVDSHVTMVRIVVTVSVLAAAVLVFGVCMIIYRHIKRSQKKLSKSVLQSSYKMGITKVTDHEDYVHSWTCTSTCSTTGATYGAGSNCSQTPLLGYSETVSVAENCPRATWATEREKLLVVDQDSQKTSHSHSQDSGVESDTSKEECQELPEEKADTAKEECQELPKEKAGTAREECQELPEEKPGGFMEGLKTNTCQKNVGSISKNGYVLDSVTTNPQQASPQSSGLHYSLPAPSPIKVPDHGFPLASTRNGYTQRGDVETGVHNGYTERGDVETGVHNGYTERCDVETNGYTERCDVETGVHNGYTQRCDVETNIGAGWSEGTSHNDDIACGVKENGDTCGSRLSMPSALTLNLATSPQTETRDLATSPQTETRDLATSPQPETRDLATSPQTETKESAVASPQTESRESAVASPGTSSAVEDSARPGGVLSPSLMQYVARDCVPSIRTPESGSPVNEQDQPLNSLSASLVYVPCPVPADVPPSTPSENTNPSSSHACVSCPLLADVSPSTPSSPLAYVPCPAPPGVPPSTPSSSLAYVPCPAPPGVPPSTPSSSVPYVPCLQPAGVPPSTPSANAIPSSSLAYVTQTDVSPQRTEKAAPVGQPVKGYTARPADYVTNCLTADYPSNTIS